MTGIIYLRTDRFEVKLEGITFKVKDFESLCRVDFLFPDGKIWSRPPVVGIDIMRHPRDHNFILLLLCIGVGCVILRFRAGEILPDPILKFLTDERIRFVGYALPKKSGLYFPYEELGFSRKKVDIRYLAATRLNDSTYQKSELKELSRKVLGIKRMIGLTEASSFERHEHIKCAICQLFITTAIGMKLLGKKRNEKLDDSTKMNSFLKTLNSLPLLLSEGFQKLPKVKNDNKPSRKIEIFKNDVGLHKRHNKEGKVVDDIVKEGKFVDDIIDITHKMRVKEGNFVDDIDSNHKKRVVKEGKFVDDIIDITNKMRVKEGNFVDDIDSNHKRRVVKEGNFADDIDITHKKRVVKEENFVDDIIDISHKKRVVKEGNVVDDIDIKHKMQVKEGNFVDDIGINHKMRVEKENFVDDININPKMRVKKENFVDDIIDKNVSPKLNNGIQLETQVQRGFIVDGTDKSVDKRKDEQLSNGFVHPKVTEGSFKRDGLLKGNFDLAKVINRIKDGVSLKTKGRENYSRDNSPKDNYYGTPKKYLKGLWNGNGLLDDNFNSAKVTNYSKDGVSLSINEREKYSNDNSSKDIFEFSEGHLRGLLSGANDFLNDNFDSVKPIKFMRSMSTNGRENYASDNSSKDNTSGIPKTPLRGILKRSSSSRLDVSMEVPSPTPSFKDSSTPPNNQLRRANSKGRNVSFTFKL